MRYVARVNGRDVENISREALVQPIEGTPEGPAECLGWTIGRDDVYKMV